MPRGPRLNIIGGIYHAMARGNRKAVIFEDDRDRIRFIDILCEALDRYGVRLFAETRMGNHYHLIVQTPRASLPAFMAYLNGGFSRFSNARHHRIGHLFNERYTPVLIDGDFHLRVAAAYVAMNPVTHGFVEKPDDWKWSSYRATAGLEPAPEYLCLDWLASAFPAADRSESRRNFVDYLQAANLVEAESWEKKVAFGSSPFEEELRKYIGANLFMESLPRAYRALNRPPLEELFAAVTCKADRNRQILRAHVLHAYTMTEIARGLDMHPDSVSRVVAALRRSARKMAATSLQSECRNSVPGTKPT